jgi:hypothetical protein
VVAATELPIFGDNVTVTLEERGLVRTTQTGSQGHFVMPFLPVGTYSIKVEASGFKLYPQHGVVLTANRNVRVDARLEIGTLGTTQKAANDLQPMALL